MFRPASPEDLSQSPRLVIHLSDRSRSLSPASTSRRSVWDVDRDYRAIHGGFASKKYLRARTPIAGDMRHDILGLGTLQSETG
jgi:hypothetical protein